MAEEPTLLTKVKQGLGVTGSNLDGTLTMYIDEVKAFMKSAGVRDSIIASATSAGAILRGVADLWNLESGTTDFSNYFKMRVIQLAAMPEPTPPPV
ncbi:MAG: hypothetical protein WBL80_04020 [Erysipelotrichaceae bacterium]